MLYLTAHKPLLREMDRLHAYASSMLPILITGETGVGKEMMARGIHRASKRSQQPFVVINCAGLPESMLEAELFGFQKGAFTGAIASRKGRLSAGHHGTVLLDEIGDLPVHLQVKILRCLEEGVIWPIGAREPEAIDIRFLAATNRGILDLITQGLFREDLFHRIAGHVVVIPPLRQRREDIRLIADTYDQSCCQDMDIAPWPGITDENYAWLEEQKWLGNIRALQWAILKGRTLAGAQPMTNAHMAEVYTEETDSQGLPPLVDFSKALPDMVNAYRARVIISAVQATKGNKTEAARLLRINRTTLVETMKTLGIAS